METELKLARFVRETTYEQLPAEAVAMGRRILLTTLATGVAGAGEEGIDALRGYVAVQKGAPEATVLIFGERVPATAAALVNGTMCRALDFCDAMAPGLHIGSSVMPAALAVAELRGGCSGRDFLTALTVGIEVASRMNLSEQGYNGFDPTGVAAVFGAAAAAARLLELSEQQTLHALALAFNRAGGSFQSNVDGSLAVRLIQGWAAETGVMVALLAERGLTGPKNFIEGVYGYSHLFGGGLHTPASFVDGLGERYALHNMMFKKYPSCGVTQGATELALGIKREHRLEPEDIESASVFLPPYAFRLVGHPFAIGENPRVNAQFSARYCVANAFVRGASKLNHFTEAYIRDEAVNALAERVDVTAVEAMNARDHSSVDLEVRTRDGRVLRDGLDFGPGYPANPLTEADHLARFEDCMAYAAVPLAPEQAARIPAAVEALAQEADVRNLLPLVMAASAPAPVSA